MIKFGKKISDVDKELPALVELMSKKEDVLVMYLFGSRALNTADDLSDIDIALLLKSNDTQVEKEMDLLGEITSMIKTDEVSLVVLNKAPLVIRYGVIKEAKVLYCADDNARLDFEESVSKQYFDFKYFLNIYDHEFISIMQKGNVS